MLTERDKRIIEGMVHEVLAEMASREQPSEQPLVHVVERMALAYIDVTHETMFTTGSSSTYAGMTAALAVAREGMVSASELGEWRDTAVERQKECDRWAQQAAQLEQQLASMVRLDVVEKAMREVGFGDGNIKAVRARLHQPEPTQQEIILDRYRKVQEMLIAALGKKDKESR
jgi:uncharacterized tellurite resistance protein B-like protein